VPQRVAIQQKIWMPVGSAMAMLATMKNTDCPCDIPAANMWWAQSAKPSPPVVTSEPTMAG